MNDIGIIGQGFVGTAIREGMKHSFKWLHTTSSIQKT